MRDCQYSWVSCGEFVLQRTALRCSALQCVAMRCSVLQSASVCCSVLQCVAVCCSVLQCIAARVHTCAYSFVSHRVHSLSSSPPLCLPPSLILMHSHCPSPLVCKYLLTLNRTATLDRAYIYCNTLQHSATHCNTLQLTATYCSILQHTATYCSTLQHTAAHWRLQHIATHCNTLPFYVKM